MVGIAIALFTLSPHIKVYPNAAMKPERTIDSPFVIENGSILSIRDLRFEYLFRSVESKGPSWHNRSTGALTATDLPTTTLRGGESTTAICIFPISFVKPITMADVEISVFYRYLFWNRNDRYRFITLQTKDGSLMWTPKAMADE
jgi:hypothetical protein